MAAELSGTMPRALRINRIDACGHATVRSVAIDGVGDQRMATAYLLMEMDAAGGVLSCR